jgi:hypothetical protein
MSAVIKMGLALFAGRLVIDAGIILLWSGLGLLRWSDGWRRFSVGLGWFSLFALPATMLLFVRRPTSMTLDLFGETMGSVPGWLAVLLLAAAVAAIVWEIWVLSSRRICTMFWQHSQRRVESPLARVSRTT